jgi:hypothetical protein
MNTNEARSEDLAWITEWYGTPAEAARRLGLSQNGLEKWCMTHDPEVLERLRLNEARRKGVCA